MTQPRHHRISSLDFLRSIAIIMVILWHLKGLNGKRLIGGPIGENLLWGVDLFFVLSGYLIGYQLFKSYIANKKSLFKEFYIRRILRTWPCFFFVLGLYLLLPGFHESREMPPVWKFLTFTQNFGLSFSSFSHAWSLCIEEQFYFLFPIILYWLVRSGGRKLTTALIVFIILYGLALRGWIWTFLVDHSTPKATEATYFSLIYYPTWGRIGWPSSERDDCRYQVLSIQSLELAY